MIFQRNNHGMVGLQDKHCRLLTGLFICVFILSAGPELLIAQENSKTEKKPSLVEFKKLEWGAVHESDGKLICSFQRLNGGSFTIPKLNNPIEKIVVESSGEELKLKPGITQWEIVLPKSFGSNDRVLISVTGKPRLAEKPIVVSPNDKGVIFLKACEATTHGKLLRYEPQPHKNTLGYWANENDWADWKFSVGKDAAYKVEILQGCGKGQGGSQVDVVVGENRLSFEVQDTGHFQNFVWRDLGTVDLEANDKTALEIRPTKKAKGAVMDVRAVRLTPAR